MGIDCHIHVKGTYLVNPRKKWDWNFGDSKYFGYFGEGYGSSPWASHIMFEEAFDETKIYKKTGYGDFSWKDHMFHWKPEILESRYQKACEALEERGTPWKIQFLRNFLNTYTMLCKKGFKPWISVSY